MFERYTESARRALFFARYAVTELGGSSIEPEHLLLGLLRTRARIESLLDRSTVPAAALREEVVRSLPGGERVSTSVEIPFGDAAKQVLQFALEEAVTAGDRHVGPEHLLLALLREGTSAAARSMTAHGLTLDDLRREVAALPDEPDASPGSSEPA